MKNKRNHRRPQGTARNAARRENVALARQAEALRESRAQAEAGEREWAKNGTPATTLPSDAPFFV